METVIEIIQKCKNRCIHCSSMSSPTSNHIMKYSDVLDLMRDDVCISGGEPLLHPDASKIINNREMKVYTSGIDGFRYDDIRKDTVFIFGIQSVEEAVHDKITCRKGSWEETVRSINECVKLGFRVGAHIVPMEYNKSQLLGTSKWLKSIGVKEISMLKFVPQGRGSFFPTMPIDVNMFEGAMWGRPWHGGCNGNSNKIVYRYDGTILNCEAEKWK